MNIIILFYYFKIPETFMNKAYANFRKRVEKKTQNCIEKTSSLSK